RLTFQGDQYAGRITYNWIATPAANDLGFYNVRDFGAVGDGRTDDTTAIRSAIAFIASRGGGGTLRFPEGDYLVGSEAGFKGITLAPGITIEGVGSLWSGAAINNVSQRSPSRITLARGGENRAVFRIGECTERVAVRDIELYSVGQNKTYGIEAVGAFLTSQDFFIERVIFNQFNRGIFAHALPNTMWQFDFIKVRDSRFLYNTDAGIWIDVWNSDWKIEGSFFQAPQKTATQNANGIYIYRTGMMLIEDTFAGVPGGATQPLRGGDFIHVIENSNLTVIGCQSEGMARSLVFGELAGAGNLSYPITLLNNIFGEIIDIKSRRMLVSTGNLYNAGSVRLAPDVQVYSTGDRFCYDGNILGCQAAPNPQAGFIGGKILFSTGQPANGSVAGRPAVIGSEVQMPSFRSNELPRNSANGTMLFCPDCRRNSPCSGGGSGAPAMMINGRWECL
ncbi:MAG TPA: glycosyl hydrolase family 28-related protein, partial [Pyrinomonadaceae bacterium]|nr:glycosyl hydrolase family 28-related protein [Pyrinomonadaceae bacterium]